MYKFQSELIKTDVTSIKISDKSIYAGIGGYLHVFDKSTNKLTNKITIFNGESIQGLLLNNEGTILLVHGKNLINAYSITNGDVKLLNGTTTNDWILTAKFIENGTKIVTISAHNAVSLFSNNFDSITTVKCQEKCILYCACLTYETWTDLTALSGTVFSEILLWQPAKSCSVIRRLKAHSGVLFSIQYNPESNLICSTSDDRSAVLWETKTGETLLTELAQPEPRIVVKTRVFGHVSRVFRCLVLNRDYFVTGGEDSCVNIWDFDGRLVRKLEVHHGAPVWALDYDEEGGFIASGGADCGLTIFSLKQSRHEEKLSVPCFEAPKTVALLEGDDLVAVTEKGALFHYRSAPGIWEKVCGYDDLERYFVLQVSPCRKLVALAGYYGQIYVYRCAKGGLEIFGSCTSARKSRVFSLHWLNCRYFLTCESNGVLTLYSLEKNSGIKAHCNFNLPACKERWTTTACTGPYGAIFVGDRKGHVHSFKLGESNAVQTIKKAHSHLGVTQLSYDFKTDVVTSLGRNAVICKYVFTNFRLERLSSDKTPIAWLSSIANDELLLSFSGNDFVVWNRETRRTLMRHDCGGGHRSWDFRCDPKRQQISFVYVKNKTIARLRADFRLLTCTDLLDCYHNYETNAASCLTIGNDRLLLVSGGEDTTLRLSFVNKRNAFERVSVFKTHLSSVRAICTRRCEEGHYLICSAGGRAQLVLWKLAVSPSFGVTCSEECNFYESLAEESETRVMDVEFVETASGLALFAACSDGNIKIYKVGCKYELLYVRSVFYNKRVCLLKLLSLSVVGVSLVVTTATDGCLVFWDSRRMFGAETNTSRLSSYKIHQSGVCCCDFNLVGESVCCFLTGGDDCAVILTVFKFGLGGNKEVSVARLGEFRDVKTHCTQVTGVKLFGGLFMTVAIDQRVTVFRWEFSGDALSCELLGLYVSTIADIQGMCCLRRDEGGKFDVMVYGRGFECLNLQTSE